MRFDPGSPFLSSRQCAGGWSVNGWITTDGVLARFDDFIQITDRTPDARGDGQRAISQRVRGIKQIRRPDRWQSCPHYTPRDRACSASTPYIR